MSDSTSVPSTALIPVSSASPPQMQDQELENTANMTLTPSTPRCSILGPSSAETGDDETATKSTSTALVPRPVNWPLRIDDDESEPFPFTKLPAELRNMVYRYLLRAPGPIHTYWFRKPKNPNFAAILQVSRLTNAEATVILYRENLFRFMARTLPVPFADAYPNRIIDIPSRFVPFLKLIFFSSPRRPGVFPTVSQDMYHDDMREMGNAISQLATDAPNLERISYLVPYHKGRIGIPYWEPKWQHLFTTIFESIAKHRSLKSFMVIYGPIYAERSMLRIYKCHYFPPPEHMQVAAVRTLAATLRGGPHTWVIPFVMNGTAPAS